ncbi:exodeoxyribonuclease V subunit alpha [methane-oxidizing endosymbiont of Gigantopelta aegis]|uniref:exodeoxyribonuclease V subunit alpha n=1 Tax=methane-oxidizing endosymbiont of Gigantopelta aegis TaxID=2794938 RepID=UPI0018DC484C|nr:exodeoxyribonuclease V subunit alpha [methane-oxidizing endosymbiont of Gigantopelta aegis]
METELSIETIHQLEPGCRRLDRAFAAFLLRFTELAGENKQKLRLILQRLSAAQADGHSCIQLNDEAIKLVERSGLVDKEKPKALILEQNRLYMQRYWAYEQRLAEQLVGLTREQQDVVPEDAILERYFPALIDEIDWQKIAAENALKHALTIISGGPGTGKTTTVVKILALLLEQRADLAIALAAPTGKAAMRLQESVVGSKPFLPCAEAIKQLIPEQVSTLHHLLGSRPPTPYFWHHADNPLPYDVVVVDEVSMVDLALMSKLVDALKPGAKLILLGDKEQLSSVEAGSVLADLTEALPEHTQELLKSHRFQGDIKALAEAIKCQQAREAWHALQNLDFVSLLQQDVDVFVQEKYESYWRLVKQDADASEILQAFNRFQVLCANRYGPLSVQDMNSRIEKTWHREGVIDLRRQWYAGRPVMVVENNARMQLFNGDIGLCLLDDDGQLMVFFVRADGRIQHVLPARMPLCQTCYAMTIHKSQGSEFEEVLVVLPDEMNPVLSKELLYTAVTRAKQTVHVLATETVFNAAVQRKMQRLGGLSWKIRQHLGRE